MKSEIDQPDLFLTAVSDIGYRDQIDLMSVPIVSLAKSKRTAPIRFTRGNIEVEVSAPPHIGLATIYDLDVVLWAISQVNDAVNRGEKPPPTVQAPAYDILTAIRRGTGGDHYDRLKDALDRLVATTVRTNMRSKNNRRFDSFHLVERVTWVEDDAGRSKGVAITLPDWLYSAILERRVLALDPRYFDLTSGLARWLYRVCRKQAGDGVAGWRWSLAELHQRSGVTRPVRQFAADIRKLVAEQARDPAGALPEYWLTLYTDQTGGEALHAVRRSRLAVGVPGREARVRRSNLDPRV